MSSATFALSASEPRSLSLLRTAPRFTPTALRIGLGVVMLPHGAQKLLGWFGGFGFTNTLHYFTDTLGVSAPLAVLVILAESIGALALVLGLATRVAAAGIAMVMVGAVAMVHLPNGFFMNWAGNQSGRRFRIRPLGAHDGDHARRSGRRPVFDRRLD